MKFIAKETVFDGVPGYMVKQLHNGRVVATQFIRKDNYESFCDSIRMTPKLVK